VHAQRAAHARFRRIPFACPLFRGNLHLRVIAFISQGSCREKLPRISWRTQNIVVVRGAMSQQSGGTKDDTVRGAYNVNMEAVKEPVAQDVHVKSHADTSINGQDCATPPAIYKRLVAGGKAKAEKPIVELVPAGLLAGFFIAIGELSSLLLPH